MVFNGFGDMVLGIHTNIAAMHAQHTRTRVENSHADTLVHLSSGNRINNAKDDAAGLQISNKLQAHSQGMDVAIRNANDGISILQTADSGMAEYSENLMRMRDLALQYANGIHSNDDKAAIEKEYDTLKDELNRITESTSFAGQKLLNGQGGRRTFQIGAESGEGLQVELPNLRDPPNTSSKPTAVIARSLSFNRDWQAEAGDKILFGESTDATGPPLVVSLKRGDTISDIVSRINSQVGDQLRATISSSETDSPPQKKDQLVYYGINGNERYSLLEVTGGSHHGDRRPFHGLERDIEWPNTHANDNDGIPSLSQGGVTIDKLDSLIKRVDSERAKLGATQNRLSHAMNNLAQSSENIRGSHSEIKNSDYAKETTKLTKTSMLSEVTTTMLAQANRSHQQAVSLLG